ncbi:MAG: hypothetical protein AYK19_06380 [Theionarchaea archaeon DG-70-1]|nr:MAG: hypothetical protein AYK19_06380 [Theionarchaea archaeon DG-70-1]
MKVRPPNQTFLEMTRACNFRCEHCFSTSGPVDKDQMSTEDFYSVFDQLAELGVFLVNMTGGEPLLRDDILDLLEYTENYSEQIHLLFTNASLWTKEFFDEFIKIWKTHPIDIQVSLDGHSYETYGAARGGTQKDFERVTRTIKKLVEEGVRTVACFTVRKKTIGHMFETAQFALEELGVNAFHVIPLFASGRAIPNYEEIAYTFEEWSSLVRDYTILKRDSLWGGLEKRVNLGFFTWYEVSYPLEQAGLLKEMKSVWNLDKEEFKSMYRKVFCEAGVTELYIKSNGDVYPCVPSVDTEFLLGNVTETPIRTIWENSHWANWFRTEARDVGKKEPCNTCEYTDVCCGGCRVSALILCHDKDVPDPRCPIVQEYQSS